MKRIYIPGTYYIVPTKFIQHLIKFRKIGKNVFTICGGHLPTLKELQQNRTTLGELTSLKGEDFQIGKIVTELTKIKYVRATGAEVKAYEASRAGYLAFIEAFKAKEAARKADLIDKACEQATHLLIKHGRLPVPAPTKVASKS